MLHKLIGHILEAADETQEEWHDVELSLVRIIAKKKQLESERDEWREHAELNVKVAEEWQRQCVQLETSLKDRDEDLKFEHEKCIQLEAENKLKQIEIAGLGSQLLDVQQEYIKLEIELRQLRVEGARADDC